MTKSACLLCLEARQVLAAVLKQMGTGGLLVHLSFLPLAAQPKGTRPKHLLPHPARPHCDITDTRYCQLRWQVDDLLNRRPIYSDTPLPWVSSVFCGHNSNLPFLD
jgi:hypothetical protein